MKLNSFINFFSLFFFQSNLTNVVKSTLIPDEKIGYMHSQATFLSKITFFWLTPLILQGYRNPLELDDLGTLHESDTCRTQYDRFHFIYKSFEVCILPLKRGKQFNSSIRIINTAKKQYLSVNINNTL